jgi:hypothetical protein
MVQLGKSVKYNDDCKVTRYREKFIGKATIIIKEFRTDEESAALYAWGIAICGPRETFDENEGTRRANGRADWVIDRFERRKCKCDFSVYQKRYGHKYNRKLLKENQLSPSEKDQFGSLDEIVAAEEKAEVTGSELPLENRVEPAPASTPAEVYNNPELTFVGPGPGSTGGCDTTPYNGKKDEPKESAPAYEPAPTPEPILIPPAPVQASEPTPLPPAAPSFAGIIDLAAFFEQADLESKPKRTSKKSRRDSYSIGEGHTIGAPIYDNDYFPGDHRA